MTIAEQILLAVAKVVAFDAESIFSREDIRNQAGVRREDWDASYSPIFQGMRIDQPGGAPNVGVKYKSVFEQVEHGKHTLTDYGRKIIAELEVKVKMIPEVDCYKQTISEVDALPEEYLPFALQILRSFREGVSLKLIAESSCQGWREAQEENLWDDIGGDNEELNELKRPIAKSDKSLNQHTDKVLFPDKLDKANEALRTVGLPKTEAKSKE